MVVNYHEALVDESFVRDWRKKLGRWRTDPGARTDLGWCPGPKTYVNGVCVGQVVPERAEWTTRPYPEKSEPQAKFIAYPPTQHEQQPQQASRGEAMEVDNAPSSSPAPAPRRPLPTNGPSNGGSEANMIGHFAGDFAGYSMHGATGSRPSSSGEPNGGPSHPAHPALPTFRTLSPELTNGDSMLEKGADGASMP